MNYGTIDSGELFIIKFNGNQIIALNSHYLKESEFFFCYNDNTTLRLDSYVPWPELLEYVNPTHSANSFTLSFVTNFDGNLND